MNQEKIGKLIKELRSKNNLTQKDFADKYGVTYQAVSKWENGKNLPDIETLKEMCNEFNIDINDLLDGNNQIKKNNKPKVIIGIILIVIFVVGLIVVLNNNDKYEFKPVSSSCKDYKITGIAAYDSKKSSLYISKIEYCGEENNTIYDTISCTLYEKYNNTITMISSCKESNNMNIKNYLENIEIKVDNYSTVCKDFKNANIYLEINTTDSNHMNYKHEIPLEISDNCQS